MPLQPAFKDKHEDTIKTDILTPDIKNSSLSKHVTFKISSEDIFPKKKTKNVDNQAIKIVAHKIEEALNKKEEVKELAIPKLYLDTATAILVATARQHNQLSIQDTLESLADIAKDKIELLGTKALNCISQQCHELCTSIVNSIHQTVDKIGMKKIKQDFGLLCKQAAVLAQELI